MGFVGDFLGEITGAKSAAKGAERASRTQAASAQAGIDEQRRQFDAITELMSPYVGAGTSALEGQKALAGALGVEAQHQSIEGIAQSPHLQALMQQGEEALLQSASATGGLRGGNIQGALAQFRPGMLQQAIDQQYGRLGGLTKLGQASAARQAAAGQASAGNVAELLQQQGAALAGGQLAKGQMHSQAFGDVLGGVTGLFKAGAF